MKIKISNAKLIILAILTFVIETIAIVATQNLTGINRIFIIISFTLITTFALFLSYILIQVLYNMIMDRKIAGEIRKYMLDYEQNGNLDKLFQNFKKIKTNQKQIMQKACIISTWRLLMWKITNSKRLAKFCKNLLYKNTTNLSIRFSKCF